MTSARIAELESQLAAAKSDIESLTLQRDEAEEDRDEKDLELTRMTAHAERLREVLGAIKFADFRISGDDEEFREIVNEALAATPAQSLEAHDRGVLEAAFERLMACEDDWGFGIVPRVILAAILGSATEQSEGSLGEQPKDFASKNDARQNKEDK